MSKSNNTVPIYAKLLSKFRDGYHVDPSTIYEFFSREGYQIKIPEYQRPYSWTKMNIASLLSDIDNINSKDKESWFFGPIFNVLDGKASLKDLLDGQQRITTIQILMRELSLIGLSIDGLDLKSENLIEYRENYELIVTQLEKCLYNTDVDGYKTVFIPEPGIENIFKDYILNFRNIESYDELKIKREELKSRLSNEKKNGSPSALTFIYAIEEIQKYIHEKFVKNPKNVKSSIDKFIKYSKALLHNSWVIEISLLNHYDSIEIFESLNNRGKGLTLTDKIRYKTLVGQSSENVEKFRKIWKEIYSELSEISGDVSSTGEKYFDNEDRFFDYFLRAISGEDVSGDIELLKILDDEVLSRNRTQEFLNDAKNVLEFYACIRKRLDSDNEFLDKLDENINSNKVKALLQIIYKSVKASKNSNLLYIHIIKNNYNKYENNIDFINKLYFVLKIVFFQELFLDTKSNYTRIEYHRLIRDGLDTYELPRRKSSKIGNLISTKDQDTAKLLLYLYAFYTNYESIIKFGISSHKTEHLEHFLPHAWKKNWLKSKFTINEIDSYLGNVGKKHIIFEDYYTYSAMESFVIENMDDLLLKEYSFSPKKDENNIIEFIGNKWILYYKKNIVGSNSKFEHKMYGYTKGSKEIEGYIEGDYLKLPVSEDKLGFNSYKSWSFENIIERSFDLLHTILDGLFNDTSFLK